MAFTDPAAASRPRIRVPRPPWLLPLAMGLVATLLFLCLGHEAAIEQEHDALELVWMRAVSGWRTPLLTQWMLWVHHVHDLVIAGAIALLLTASAYRRRWRDAWLVLAICVGGMVCNLLAKNLFQRPRPVVDALVAAHGFAFPSGHTIAAAVVAASMVPVAWRWARSPVLRGVVCTVAMAMVAVVGCSRVYLGAHFPSDVLASLLEALAWSSLCVAADRFWIPPMAPLLPAHRGT